MNSDSSVQKNHNMYAAGIKGTMLDQSIQLPKRWRKSVKNRERREKPAER